MNRSNYLITLGLLAGPSVALGQNATPVQMRDIGAVTPGKYAVKFIVSQTDAKSDEALREFEFKDASAQSVVIAGPVDVRTNKSVLGSRVEAYESDKQTPFQFGLRTTPVTMYLRGKQTSAMFNDTAFEYEYYKDPKGMKPLYGASAVGAVVKITMDRQGPANDTPRLQTFNKLLSSGQMTVKATVTPKLPGWPYTSEKWSYDGDGQFAVDTSESTTFMAGVPTPTAQQGQPMLRFTVTEFDGRTFSRNPPPALKVEARLPLDITKPNTMSDDTAHLGSPGSTPLFSTSAELAAEKNGTGNLFYCNGEITYTVRDQFQQNINQSAFGGAQIQVQEVTPWSSPIQALRVWLSDQNNVQTVQHWTTPRDAKTRVDFLYTHGQFKDHLKIPLRVSMIMGKTAKHNLGLLLTTRGAELFGLHTHDWFVSILSQGQNILQKQVTQNELSVTVQNYADLSSDEEVQFHFEYTVKLLP